MTRPSTVTIVLAEPLAVVRAGLAALLAAERDFAVVGHGGEAISVERLVSRLRPDVLILEPRLQGQPIEDLLSSVLAGRADTRVLLLADPSDLPLAASLLDKGAAGCFLKGDRPEELLRGVRAVVEGELAASGAVARYLLKRSTSRKLPPPLDALTEREHEVYDLLSTGLSNKEIAQTLYLSVRTVEVHLRSVYAKLGVRSRLEAVTKIREST